jgi:hypothetical protein
MFLKRQFNNLIQEKEKSVMKKSLMLISLFSLLLIVGSVSAQTSTYVVRQPIFLISFPDAWKVTLDNPPDVLIFALSPDDEIEYDIWALPAGDVKADVKAALNDAIKDINETIAKYATNANFSDWHFETINGIEFVWAEGTGKEVKSGKTITMEVDFFSPDDKSLYALMYWGTPEAEKKYKAEIDKIDRSIKKAR